MFSVSSIKCRILVEISTLPFERYYRTPSLIRLYNLATGLGLLFAIKAISMDRVFFFLLLHTNIRRMFGIGRFVKLSEMKDDDSGRIWGGGGERGGNCQYQILGLILIGLRTFTQISRLRIVVVEISWIRRRVFVVVVVMGDYIFIDYKRNHYPYIDYVRFNDLTYCNHI